MFLGLVEAADAIKAAIQQGLGPIALIGSMTFDQILTFAIDFGIQIVATVILFIAIRFLFWKPITKILESRKEQIDKDLADAEQAKANALEIEASLNKELADAKAKVKEMLDNAEKEANIKRETIINSAKDEARRRLDNLEVELVEEKRSMEKQIKQEIVDIAFQAAEKIVSKEIDHDKYLDVVDDIIKGAIK